MGKTWRQIVNEAYTQPILFVLKQLYDALQPWQQYSYHTTKQRHYMANYEYLIERIIKYSRVDTITLNQFAVYLKVCILTGQQQLSREIEDAEDDIRLICTTIHKSKGLEYGTVILPYTYEDIGDLRKVKLDVNYSASKLSYTVLFDNKIRERNSNYNEIAEAGEQIAEESRILYVALTRAIRNCVWINNVDSNSSLSWGTLMEE
jgi:ATP-dependent exoDNAse (exonuclease V) beta subunit